MPLPDDIRTEVQRLARIEVFGGYQEPSDIALDLIDHVEDTCPGLDLSYPEIEEEVASIVLAMFDVYAMERSRWPEVTDYDRLRRAFDRLEQAGVLTGEDVGSTLSELAHEMHYAARDAVRDGREIIGWVAFHNEQLEQVADGRGGDLVLAYGPHGGQADEDWIRVGRRVVDELEQEGLDVVWHDSPDTRIEIRDILWQKRRSTRTTSNRSD